MDKGHKLWNKDFFILWQGQLISDLGNGIFYAILGFWVLDLTGSKLLMGTILACLSIPRVILGPFAGAFSDRHSRKWIIVFADLVRGLLFALTGFAAIAMKGQFPVAVLYPIAILSGICSAFFSPAIISSIPDIVPMDKLTKANSMRTLSQSASSLVGYACGGVLYGVLGGAPKLVFGYGLCFLYAAITQFFMKIPRQTPVNKDNHILHDMIDGMKYTFSQKGIRTLIVIGMFLNFFANMGVVLLAPLFKYEPGYGEAMYGAVMATMMVGQLLGMAFVSFAKIKPKDRPLVFFTSVVALIGCMIPVGLASNVYVMFPLALICGASIAIMTVLLYTLLQVTVQPENRGRVFGIMSTVFEGLTPFAMMASGGVSEAFGVRQTIVGAFACAAVVLCYAFINKPFKVFLKSEPLPDTVAPAADQPAPPY